MRYASAIAVVAAAFLLFAGPSEEPVALAGTATSPPAAEPVMAPVIPMQWTEPQVPQTLVLRAPEDSEDQRLEDDVLEYYRMPVLRVNGFYDNMPIAEPDPNVDYPMPILVPELERTTKSNAPPAPTQVPQWKINLRVIRPSGD